MDTIIYIIVASLTIGGVLGRMSSLKEVTMLTKRTEKEQEQTDESFKELFARMGVLEKELVRQGTRQEAMAGMLERMQETLEGWRK